VLISGDIFDYDKVLAVANPKGNKSKLCKKMQAPIEGIVIKPITETKGYMGRMVFKLLNDAYWLAKGNSDWH
jgi:hypothetical protein